MDFESQLGQYKKDTMLGYHYRDNKQYFYASRAFEQSCIDLLAVGREYGWCRDLRPAISKNVRLNHGLKYIHLNYKLNYLFLGMHGEYWTNTSSDKQLLGYALKDYKTVPKVMNNYLPFKFQNLLPNADVKLRQKYGCFGLLAIKNYWNTKK